MFSFFSRPTPASAPNNISLDRTPRYNNTTICPAQETLGFRTSTFARPSDRCSPPTRNNPGIDQRIALPATPLVTPSTFSLPPNTLPSSRRGNLNVSTPHISTRRSRRGSSIIASSFRPASTAADRLFAWRSPYGLEADRNLEAQLPADLIEAMHMSIRSFYAPNTKGNYGAGILRFTQFCDHWDIPEAHRMPAAWPLLCAFISDHRGKVAGNTVKAWMAGIRAWHIVNRAPWYGDDNWVSMCRTAAKREGTRYKRPLRAPVSMEHLLVLRRTLDLSISFHAAVWATALVSFFGCRRLGETTIPSSNALDPKLHVLASSPVHFSTTSNGTRSATFRIPWTKTTREEGAQVILTARPDNLVCPVQALFNHCNIVNIDRPSGMSFFTYRSDSGAWTEMVKTTFLGFCDSIWKSAGLNHVLGHSFRIGGAVELLLAGVNPDVVAATGGWTSLAFLLYWRRMEDIIPLSTSRAYKKSHLDHLISIFEDFHLCHAIPHTFMNDIGSLD